MISAITPWAAHYSKFSTCLLFVGLMGGCVTPTGNPVTPAPGSVFGVNGAEIHLVKKIQPDDYAYKPVAPIYRPNFNEEQLLENTKIPTGALPNGLVPDYLADGRQYRAVVGTRVNPKQAGRKQQEMWLFKRRWQRLGKIAGIGKIAEHDDLVARWNRDGSELGLMCVQFRTSHLVLRIGTINLRSLQFDATSYDWETTYPRTLLWLGQEILMVCCDMDHRSDIYAYDPVKHRNQLVYSDNHEYINAVDPSPDNIHIAFDRNKMDWAQLGIWVLNIKSGKCQQITAQHGGCYFHRLGHWDSPNHLLFLNQNQLYRAALDLLP